MSIDKIKGEMIFFTIIILVDSEFQLQDSRGTLIGQGEGTSGLDRVSLGYD